MECRLDIILSMLNLLVIMLLWLYTKRCPYSLERHAEVFGVNLRCHKIINFLSNGSLKKYVCMLR